MDIEKNIVEWFQQLKEHRRNEQEKIPSEPKKKSDEELKEMIQVGAYFLSHNQLSYIELCWMLAEKQLIIQKGDENVTENEIRKKSEEVFRSSCTYDELCWLISELNILIDSSLEQIYQYDKYNILLQFYSSRAGKQLLRISLPSFIYLTKAKQILTNLIKKLEENND